MGQDSLVGKMIHGGGVSAVRRSNWAEERGENDYYIRFTLLTKMEPFMNMAFCPQSSSKVQDQFEDGV